MNEAEKKIEAIRQVLMQRKTILNDVLARCSNMNDMDKQWYSGRIVGMDDALDLLRQSLESICVELEKPTK